MTLPLPIPWIAALTLLAGCAPTSPPPIHTGTITGRVRHMDTTPVTDATVEAGGRSAQVDAYGRFELHDVPSGEVSVFAHSPTTTLGHRKIVLDEEADLTLRVVPTETLTLADAAAGGTVAGEGFAIEFPPGVIVDERGAAVSGEVEVRYALLDSVAEFSAAPGELQALGSDGNGVALASGGMFFAELSQGDAVLNVGAPVNVRFAAATEVPDLPGYVAWSFDEGVGAWVEEGSMERVGGEIQAVVPHFSYWNYDMVIAWEGCVTATLQLADTTAVTGEVGVWVTGGAHTNLTPDATGAVSFVGPENSTVAFSFIWTDETDPATPVSHYWATAAQPVPDPSAGCLGLGTLTETGQDGDLDGVLAVPWGDDCHATDPSRPTTEVWYDADDDDCDGNWCDQDGDGACAAGAAYVPPGYGTDDCDDEDPSVSSLAWFPDDDLDGYGADAVAVPGCSSGGVGYAPNALDCDDGNPAIHPGVSETCGGTDENCDGLTACGTGLMRFETAESGADRATRDCEGAWDQTWLASTSLCPDCSLSFEVVNTPIGTPSVDCGLDTMPASWLLSFDPDDADASQGSFWVYYASEGWVPTWLEVEQDSTFGMLSWYHQDYSTWEALQTDGTWRTAWWGGYATWAP